MSGESALFTLNLDGVGNPPQAPEQPNSGGAANHLRAAAAAEANADLAARPRRGRPRGSAASDNAALQAKIDGAIAAQLDALHDPKAWGALLALPGDVGRVITGNERWKIDDAERAALGASGSAAARTMMITNPKALAFSMLAASLISVYLPRAVAQIKEMADKKAEKKPDAAKS